MPNQRKRGKRQVAFWFTDEEITELKRTAEMLGLTMTDLIRRATHEIARTRKETDNEKSGSDNARRGR